MRPPDAPAAAEAATNGTPDLDAEELESHATATEIVSRKSGWLASVDAATFALSQIERVDDAAEMVSAAAVARVMARNVIRSRDAMNHAAYVSLLCQRRAGELLAMPRTKPGNSRSPDTLSVLLGVVADTPALADAKAQQLSSRWQRLAAIDEDVFTEAVEAIKSRGEELTTAGLIRAATVGYAGAPSTPAPSFDDRCSKWVGALNVLLTEGARLADEAETLGVVSGHAQMTVVIYRNLAERALDREIRQLLESEEAK